ncbi:DUF6525 family protein [Azospirillum rugosum]|uniref:OsmC-like protein n=1 Tax=Azospirillum rugosum TaxID=416170 RepID=A0ABS4SDU8_9PROT|nr:DUF6525 family protein [Azospirillum rugosum]MBP2290741.1 putative OsmC-like protein [Azospirillum rugosum]MDQ0525630.1 putative OsmC-like protein [Azospirillum rugosum]
MSSAAKEMRAFDGLPPEVRASLNASVCCWSAAEFARWLRDGIPIRTILATIEDGDQAERHRHRKDNERMTIRVHHRPLAEAAPAPTQQRLL